MKNKIPLHPVESSLIKAVGYEASSTTLAIEFHNGKVYHYANVEPETHAALLAADSIGGFFRKILKNPGLYSYTKCEDEIEQSAHRNPPSRREG